MLGLPGLTYSESAHVLGLLANVRGMVGVIWHQWIGVVLLVVSVLAVLGLGIAYLMSITSKRYPSRRHQQDG